MHNDWWDLVFNCECRESRPNLPPPPPVRRAGRLLRRWQPACAVPPRSGGAWVRADAGRRKGPLADWSPAPTRHACRRACEGAAARVGRARGPLPRCEGRHAAAAAARVLGPYDQAQVSSTSTWRACRVALRVSGMLQLCARGPAGVFAAAVGGLVAGGAWETCSHLSPCPTRHPG